MKKFNYRENSQGELEIAEDILSREQDAPIAACSSDVLPSLSNRVKASPVCRDLSLFCPVKKKESEYMDAVMDGDMDKLLTASTDGLELRDLQYALTILSDRNPDWMMRPKGDVVRGVITGLQGEIERMNVPSTAPTLF